MQPARTDSSILGRWWWTVDGWQLALLAGLATLGVLLTGTAGQPVAERIGLPAFHFLHRHLLYLGPAVLVLLTVSALSPRGVRRLALAVLAGGIVLLTLTLLIGQEIKGATRWLHIAGFSLQPSELIKPALAVVAAWLFAERARRDDFPGNGLALGLLAVVVVLLMLQPDLGMTVLVAGTWCVQFFLAGLPLYWVAGFLLLGMMGLAGAYAAFPHVASRIDRFANPAAGDTYQVSQSLRAFEQGGLLGRGPGAGEIKNTIPDAHADFIFAVAGEELGVVTCLVIVALFAGLVLRGLARAGASGDLFVLLAATGLYVQVGGQALINMASALHLIPTKGMTLPFISYGGSSLVGLSLGVGMALALTRRRAATDEPGGVNAYPYAAAVLPARGWLPGATRGGQHYRPRLQGGSS